MNKIGPGVINPLLVRPQGLRTSNLRGFSLVIDSADRLERIAPSTLALGIRSVVVPETQTIVHSVSEGRMAILYESGVLRTMNVICCCGVVVLNPETRVAAVIHAKFSQHVQRALDFAVSQLKERGWERLKLGVSGMFGYADDEQSYVRSVVSRSGDIILDELGSPANIGVDIESGRILKYNLRG